MSYYYRWESCQSVVGVAPKISMGGRGGGGGGGGGKMMTGRNNEWINKESCSVIITEE